MHFQILNCKISRRQNTVSVKVQTEYHTDTATGNPVSTTSSSRLIKGKRAPKSLADLMKMHIMVQGLKD